MQTIYFQNIPEMDEIDDFFNTIEDLQYHQKIITNGLEMMKDISEIEAVFLMGSLALEIGDIFSDIDFYLMYKKVDDIEKIKSKIFSRINKVGSIIHIFNSNANPKDIILYFRPYVKLELAFRTFETISNKWKIANSSKLLFDRNGLGKEAIKTAKKISFNLNRYEREIKNIAIALPSFCYNIAGYMIRGEFITSIDFVAWIRRVLMRISGFLLGMWDEGTRKAEKRFPEELINYYHLCRVKELDEIWQCLEVFLTWYSNWLVPKFEERKIPHALAEVELIRKILSKLRKKYDLKKQNISI
ncbi:MAG: hypothetical protein EU532_04610 [Promethearchaeota archaeon]|nr:MAG: hypothetical protein EU532_04610 [Candidatus Lokiarchaeota archaeon]